MYNSFIRKQTLPIQKHGVWIGKRWFSIQSITRYLRLNEWNFLITFELGSAIGTCSVDYKYSPSSMESREKNYKINISLQNYSKVRETTFFELKPQILHEIRKILNSYVEEVENYEDSIEKPHIVFLEHVYMKEDNMYILYFRFENSCRKLNMRIYLNKNDTTLHGGRYKLSSSDTFEEDFNPFSSWEEYVWEQAKEHSDLKLLLQFKTL